MGALFGELRDAVATDWAAYTGHPFVRRLADGTLPEAAFRHYLGQDYLFLIHFARAYGLAVYKSTDLDEMRAAAGAMAGSCLRDSAVRHLRCLLHSGGFCHILC